MSGADEQEDGEPTLMRRRWWVTFAVVVAVAVGVVWWIRQPDSAPADEDPNAGSSASAESTLELPDTFEAADTTWSVDDSPESQAQLEAALAPFAERSVGSDGVPPGAIYVADSAQDEQEQVIAVLLIDESLRDGEATDTAERTVEFNAAKEPTSEAVDGGGVACGYLPILLDDDSTAQQWVCATAYGDAVVNLLLPLSVADADAAAAGAAADFLAAAQVDSAS